MRCLAGLCHSFIYVDLSVRREALLEEFDRVGFHGYSRVGQTDVSRQDLGLQGWRPRLRPREGEGRLDMLEKQEAKCRPFAHWSIWKRDSQLDELHGPERFSFLYFGGEACAVLQGLYSRAEATPRVIAIIQPGFLRWMDLADPSAFFARCVRECCSGTPEFHFTYHEKAYWPGYSELVLETNLGYRRLFRYGMQTSEPSSGPE